MSAPIEERLGVALRREAASTSTVPDAWRRIEDRVDRRRPASMLLRPRTLVSALAVVTLIIGAVMVNGGTERDGRVRAADVPALTRLYLVPTGVAGFELVDVIVDPGSQPAPPRTLRVFGRRAPDGVTLSASVAVVASPTLEPPTGGPAQDGDGRRVVTWREGADFVTLVTFGVTAEEEATVEASLRAGPVAATSPVLPPGFVPVFQETPADRAAATRRLTDQRWRSTTDGFATFNVTVTEAASVTMDALSWEVPAARVVTVRGTAGLLSADNRMLTWIERPGVAVSILGTTLRPEQLQEIATGLRPIDRSAWDKRIAGIPPGPQPGAPPEIPIASGERDGVPWQAAVGRSHGVGGRELLCLVVHNAGGAGGSCTESAALAPGAMADVEGTADGFVLGRVAPDVARLRVLLADGSSLEAAPAGGDAGFPTAYVVVPLPPGATAGTVVALDAGGRELSRSAVHPADFGPVLLPAGAPAVPIPAQPDGRAPAPPLRLPTTASGG
ncbi:MAG: hypothetical protein ACRDZW_09445 [Acidimicrobiales bacterium]